MILKTNPLKPILALLFPIALAAPHTAFASKSFECLRALIPVTDRAVLQSKRVGVEEPFLVNDKYIVFPAIDGKAVVGFYFYSAAGAKFYDAVDINGQTKTLVDLEFKRDHGVYDLIAQPAGLETVTVPYLPGFRYTIRKGGGPVVLGTSVLPVLGALVSRPNLESTSYHNPDDVNSNDLKRWVVDRQGDRAPASLDNVEIKRTILKLKTVAEKSREDLWSPIRTELHLRKTWIKTHNLDEKAFKQLSLAMDGSCKD